MLGEPLPPAAAVPAGRLDHLLATARHEFMTRGYQHVSIDALSRAAGVSKETIYRYFPDKAALFRAAIEGVRDAFSERLEAIGREALPPELRLVPYARAIYDWAVDTDRLSPLWVAIATAREFPELGGALQSTGLERLAPVREQIEQMATARGRPIAPPEDLVSAFGALAVEGPRHLMGWPSLPASKRDGLAAAVTRLFLQGSLTSSARRPAPVKRDEATSAPDDAAASVGDHIRTLMDVARAEFFARGFRGASLDDIGATARVGRGTLYRHFRSKDGLFEAVMLDAARAVGSARLPAIMRGTDPAAALAPYALAVAEALTSPEATALYRTVIAEAKRTPDLARQVYTESRRPLMRPLVDYLSAGVAAGVFDIADADWHAMQFLTLATGGNRYLSAPAPPARAERQATVVQAVRLFLSGCFDR